MKKKIFQAALLVGGLAGGLHAVAAEELRNVTLTTGLDYSSGDYGDSTKTEILSVPVIAKYETERWSFKATVPYITLKGPGNVVPTIGQVGTTNTTRRVKSSGIGDTVVSATYSLYQGSNALLVDVTGKVKFATANEDKGLGTGENDYATQVDVYKGLGKFTAIGTLGYRVYGNPSGITLDNVFYGSVGGQYKLTPASNIGVIYDYRPKIVSTGSEVSELTAFLTHKMNDRWKAQAYLVRGLSNGSPDYGGGALISLSF